MYEGITGAVKREIRLYCIGIGNVPLILCEMNRQIINGKFPTLDSIVKIFEDDFDTLLTEAQIKKGIEHAEMWGYVETYQDDKVYMPTEKARDMIERAEKRWGPEREKLLKPA